MQLYKLSEKLNRVYLYIEDFSTYAQINYTLYKTLTLIEQTNTDGVYKVYCKGNDTDIYNLKGWIEAKDITVSLTPDHKQCLEQVGVNFYKLISK
jgi:hypothetical protein